MPIGKLNKSSVEAIKPGAADQYLWDRELRGFGVKCTPAGRRVYLVQYRLRGRLGRTRRITIGPHGAITAEQARIEARKLLGLVAGKKDPAESRTRLRMAPSMADLCDRYLKDMELGLVMYRGKVKAASTRQVDKGRIERHIRPLLGRRLVEEMSQTDVEAFMRAVIAGETATDVRTGPHGRAIVKGGRGTAARTVSLLGGMFSHAIRLGWRDRNDNPVRGVDKPKDQMRRLRLTPENYRALGKALSEGRQATLDAQAELLRLEKLIEAQSKDITLAALEAIRFLALSGWRRGEAVTLQWPAFAMSWRIADLAATKSGPSVRLLGQVAADLVRSLKRDGDVRPWVFPGEGNGPYTALQGLFERLRKRAKLPLITMHTLRHSFASEAADLGYSDSTIGALIGHQANTMTSRYIHRADPVLLAAADRIAQHISDLMTGKKTSATVFQAAAA